MNILAFDTAFAAVSACVRRDGVEVSCRRVDAARGHAEVLLPMVAEVLAEAHLEARALTRIATSCGPGHFTGLRAGLAAAQGMALASGAALVGIDAFTALRAEIEAPVAGERLLIAFDSKRTEAFLALDDEPPFAAAPAGFAAPGERFLLAGDRAADFAAVLTQSGRQVRIAAGPALPDARTLARIAETAMPSDRLVPIYIHAPATTSPRRP
ncbi:MAG: tRNA (adenosine(37)-N6)-threonylcarbamoyltransferase complex dimerization subunit type 1 TsaB [Alphaproteobacteria bacterium]|nr:tRNA (adenosine(37)-N6)-threonylcarbamoyltransferase complex dimerization subunit type 1 TsaB [Alphaproteobacteria bacterium]